MLLIDDDLVSREVMATLLTMEGFTVHTAEDGPAALALLDCDLKKKKIILMDTQMPGLSGLDLIAALRQRSQAPILAISASPPADALRAATDGFLLKPFPVSAVMEFLDQRAQAEEPAADPARLPDEPVISPETLAQFRSMMPPSAVHEIYAAVVADLHTRIPAIHAALNAGDAVEVRRIAHAIKGGCAMAGAVQAARIAAQLEADGNQSDNSTRLLADLRLARRYLERMLEMEFRA